MPACRFKDCGRPARSGGLCQGHYQQQRRGGPLRELRPRGLEYVGELRVSAECAVRLDGVGAESRTAAARLVLEAWAMEARERETERSKAAAQQRKEVLS
jgi:hypothetical protein